MLRKNNRYHDEWEILSTQNNLADEFNTIISGSLFIHDGMNENQIVEEITAITAQRSQRITFVFIED